MCWRYNILKIIKDWKINVKWLHFINKFMKSRTLRVVIANRVSEDKQIENGAVQGAVLSVTFFLVAMAEITHGIEEPISQTRTSKRRQTIKSHGQNRQMGI
jgi:hypothetical protein